MTRPARAAAAMLAALALTPGTARAEEFFDAYARGLQALRQGQGARAAEAFERAIRLRPEPGANILTYGTNRLDRYHPYLRLAEAHLMAGQPERAHEALRRSEAKGKEPAADRARLSASVETALERRAAAATPPPPAAVTVAPHASAAPPTVAATAPTEAAATPTHAATPLPTLAVAPPPPTVAAAPPQPATARTAAPVRIPSPPSGPPATTAPTAAVPSPLPTPDVTTAAAKPAPGALVVISEPPGAAVYLDDEPLGSTDPVSGRLAKSGLVPGPHRLRLARAGYRETTREVQVPAGDATVLQERLSPEAQPRVPAAALAAGAALVGVGLLLWLAWRRRATAGATVVLPPRAPEMRTSPGTAKRATPAAPGSTVSVAPTPMGELAQGELHTRTLQELTPPGQGEVFGEYRLVEKLGKGGMAVVYRAERGGETVALKRPLTSFLDDLEFRQRFLREAEIGRTLHHPNIIRIFERGQVNGVPYFTMEIVAGETLQAHVRRQGALPPRPATRLVAQVAEALDYAHLKGVVHRDLKPSNIMVLADGTVKVMDYGIARARRFDGLTLTGAFLGTPDYVAPETAEGKGSDARSDLYSLGVVFYEVLTGKKPFVGETPFATLRKHCTEPPTPPSVIMPGTPRELEAIILRLLGKSPDDRFPGAEELLIALRDYLNRAA